MLGGKEFDSSRNETHLNGADQFYVLPRKVLIFESSEIPNHCYLGTSDGCSYDHVGNSSSNLYNDIHIFGDVKLQVKRVGFNNDLVVQNSTYNIFTGAFKINGSTTGGASGNDDISSGAGKRQLLDIAVYVYDSNGQFVKIGRNHTNGDYTVDMDSGLVTFLMGNPAEVWLHYVYLDYTSYGGVEGNDSNKDYAYPNYYNSEDPTSIHKYGHKPIMLSFPQMEDITSTASLSRRLLCDLSTEKDELTIVNPRLAFGMQTGTIMTANNEVHDIHGRDMIIKSIRYSVPENKSYIVIGDHQYDILDNIEKTEDKIESVRNTSGQYTLTGRKGT